MLMHTTFWDDILYRVFHRDLYRRLNISMVGSPRQRNFSLKVGQSVHAGRAVHTLFTYPRQYVPRSDWSMSAMPSDLEQLCHASFHALIPYLPPVSLALGPFNSIQVRGYYEAFRPHTGPHTDNGQLLTDGSVEGGKLFAQAPDTAVGIYMIGDCPMLLDFLPFADGRPPVTIRLQDGWLMMLHPNDDCRCKHALRMAHGPALMQPSRIRIAFVMRQLRATARYYVDTRKIVI